MSSQLLPLLRNEITKAARRKLPWFGLAAAALLCALIFFVGGQLSGAATANAWGYVGFSMQLLFTDIGPIFIMVFASMLMSEETGTGTIRAALAAPVSRWELYLAKAVAGLFYMMVFSITSVLCSASLSIIHYHFGPVGDAFGVVYGTHRAMAELFFSFILSWIPLFALVMFGLFISTLVRTPGAAVAVAISALFLVEFTKHLVGMLDPYIFTRYITYPWMNLQQIAQGMDYQWQPDVWKMMTLSGVTAVLTFGVGLTVFVKRDLNH